MSTYATYQPRHVFFRDRPDDHEKTLFHIQSDDYFGTLATIIAGELGVRFEQTSGPWVPLPNSRSSSLHASTNAAKCFISDFSFWAAP